MSKSINKIDKNLAVQTVGDLPVVYYDVREEPFTIYGLCDPHDGTPFHRLPADIAKATNASVAQLYLHTSGGRIRFKTDAAYIAIKVQVKNVGLMPHMPLLGIAGMDVYAKTESGYHYAGSCLSEGGNEGPATIMKNQGYTNIVWLPGYINVAWLAAGMKDVTINLPLYGEVEEVSIGIPPEAKLERTDGYRDILPTVYYGSSITQGGCASRPGNNYPAILSRKFDVDFRNLGFSGGACGEQIISDYVAGLSMSALVYAYDHNAPRVEHLAATHEPMYLNVRASHPDLPIIFITRPGLRYNADEAARREVVRTTYENAKARGENVYFVDGEQIFGIFGGDGGTVDGTHPTDLGFACVAAALDPIFKEIYG